MPRVRLMVLALALVACTPSPGSPSVAPVPSNAATNAGASVPCIDAGELADSADTAITELQGVIAALKVPNVDRARSMAGTAASVMRSVADLVDPVKPDAAKEIRSSADELDSAVAAFPGGLTSVDKAQADFETGLRLAREAACPE